MGITKSNLTSLVVKYKMNLDYIVPTSSFLPVSNWVRAKQSSKPIPGCQLLHMARQEESGAGTNQVLSIHSAPHASLPTCTPENFCGSGDYPSWTVSWLK